ncbi:ABC transporter permease [Paenibacillus elgii]
MTLFELVVRSMRKDLNHYYLYFFALIFSMSLYFVFATLQHDPSVVERAGMDSNFAYVFNVAGTLLLAIVIVFSVYANSIFLKRRSREIGLYQLIGLSKMGTARFLIIENVLLSLGALFVAIGFGALISRLFLLILLKLLAFEGVAGLSFSFAAARQTSIVFAALIALTSIQMIVTVSRSTLLELFHTDKRGEHPKQPYPIVAAFFSLLGIALIGYGYDLSGRMSDPIDMPYILLLTIVGTYLLFRVSIGWLLYLFRKGRNGHWGLKNSLSLAPLMHRMKANANSLTLITVTSGMTLTTLAFSYSLYFSVESDTRMRLPYDIVFENKEQDAGAFTRDLEQAGIRFRHQPVEAVRLTDANHDLRISSEASVQNLLLLPAEQLQQAGAQVETPSNGETVLYEARGKLKGIFNESDRTFPKEVTLGQNGTAGKLRLNGMTAKYLMNVNVFGYQLLASEATVRDIGQKLSGMTGYEAVHLDTYQVPDREERAQASALFVKYVGKDEYMSDFQKSYVESLRSRGLFVFISAFLGLVFLISTGSILYFKQMTEAEQEKRSFKTLRQLGFDVNHIMSGIVRKQLFVFALPLLVGLSHSIFAVKALTEEIIMSDITVPVVITMSVYALIYFVFAVLAVGYYRRIVKNAMYTS